MANVQFFVVGVVVLALLCVPSATTASDSFNILSIPSHSHVDSKNVPSATKASDFFNILSTPSHSHVDSKPKQEYGTNLNAAPAPAPSAYNDFDYFKLVMQWAPTHCRDITPPCRMTPLPDFFYIHGLWPDNNDGASLANCNNVEYVRITDPNLLTSMNANWPNVESGASYNNGIWKHQWQKHGTCSLIKYDQTAFFNKALELHSKYDVIGKIRGEMRWRADETYQKSKLIETLKKLTGGKNPGISCLPDRSTGKQTLHEITFCFTKDGVLMDCDANRISKKCTTLTFFFPKGIPAPSPPPPPGRPRA